MTITKADLFLEVAKLFFHELQLEIEFERVPVPAGKGMMTMHTREIKLPKLTKASVSLISLYTDALLAAAEDYAFGEKK